MIKDMRYKKAAFLFGFLFLAFSCQQTTPDQDQALGPDESMDDFQAFYTRFHADEDFQLARIPFPIKGAPDNAANKPEYDENFTWTRDNWIINKPIDLEKTQFRRELQAVSDELVIEKLVHQSGSYSMVRRFAKMEGQWMLIYYQGVNPQ